MKKSEQTRLSILQKAFELIYINGYQSTSVDDILARTSVTKGAFFYHFKTKEEMGLAMIREVMRPAMSSGLEAPLSETSDPLELIYEMMEELLLGNPLLQLKYGCPTYNLIQEMAPVNEQFKAELAGIVNDIRLATVTALQGAKASGIIRSEISTAEVTDFISAGYAGIRSLGKLEDTNDIYHAYLRQLRFFLGSLK